MNQKGISENYHFIPHNPTGITDIGDPFVLKSSKGIYYLYATSNSISAKGINCRISRDLRNWSEEILCYKITSSSFGISDYWAPEVVEYGGKYIMHYSARTKDGTLRIGVAVSDKPEGMFVDAEPNKPMFDYGYAAIDGHVFMDTDGEKYFYYSRDCSENIVNGRHESHIYVSRLSEDLLKLKGEPKFLIAPEKPYETKVFRDNSGEYVWNEGPFLVKNDGKYHLLYSANFFAGCDYCICGAVSDSPLGPFVKYDKPILQSIEETQAGPGHNCVFSGPDGEMLCAYHVLSDSSHPSGNRQMYINQIKWVNGCFSIVPSVIKFSKIKSEGEIFF